MKHAAVLSLVLDASMLAAQEEGGDRQRLPSPVTVDWTRATVTRTTAPSVLVAADPEWTAEGKLSAVAIDGVRKLAAAGADNIRLLNFNIFPEMSVAQMEEGVWNFTRMDQVVLPFLDACGNASVLVDIESSPAWMWEPFSGPCPQRLAPCGTDTCADAERTDLPPSTGGGYGNRLRCPHWGDAEVPRDKTWKELATYFTRVSDWYTKGGFTLPDGTRHESGHRYKIAFWEIWNEVNNGREHGMTKEDYLEYYDTQVLALQSSPGGAVSKFGGPSLSGLSMQNVDDWMPFLLDRKNHKPETTPFDALTFHQYCMCENRTGAGMEAAFEGVENHLSALQRVQHWRDTLRPEATLHLTESGLICNAPKGCGGNNYSCWHTEFDELYWLASGSQWLYQYLRSAEAADLATIAQSQILGYPHKYDGLSGEWPCGSMVDWTKTTPAGGFPVSKHHEGALNAKYWVELLLLQHVSRPFSFHPTTNISAWPSPPIYVQGISSSKGKVLVVVNTKSTEQQLTLADGVGKKAYTICMEFQGPAGEHTLAADTVALPPFATMFVVGM